MKRLDEFTPKESERINQIIANEFEDATADDVKLYAEWEAAKAVASEEHQAKIDAIKAETEAAIEQNRKTAEAARKNLTTLKNAAKKRLEAVESRENGQEQR